MTLILFTEETWTFEQTMKRIYVQQNNAQESGSGTLNMVWMRHFCGTCGWMPRMWTSGGESYFIFAINTVKDNVRKNMRIKALRSGCCGDRCCQQDGMRSLGSDVGRHCL